VFAVWKRIRETTWRRSVERRDKKAIQKALQAHERAERAKHTERELPPEGRSNADWTYIAPP
jgi:hypothetical protein